MRAFRLRFRVRYIRTEVDRLDWLVSDLSARFMRPFSPEKVSDANVEPFVVATTWLRLAASYAAALLCLIKADLADAAYPTERALLELYTDFLYFFRHNSPSDNSVRVHVCAALELLEHFERGAGDQGLTDRVKRFIAKEEVANPGVVAALRDSRKRRHFHWSGLSRGEVGTAVMGTDYRTMYRIMSWEAHTVLTASRDFTVEDGEPRISFQPFECDTAVKNSAAYRAGGYLWCMYHEYARQFGLPSVPNPGRGTVRVSSRVI